MTKQQVIDKVLVEIVNDVTNGDMTAVEELLTLVPEENLVDYLPEDENQVKFAFYEEGL